MRLSSRKCKGGPLDGQTLHVMKSVKRYRVQKFAYHMCERVIEWHNYELDDNGVFIHKGKE